MTQLGKILLFVGMVFMLLWLVAVRVLAGNLMPFVWILLGLGVACLLGAIFRDIKFFIELSGQRTTKHGMNMGVLVLLVVVILVGVNYVFGFRHVKKLDYTKEGLHSLADQTKTVLNNLDSDLVVKAFFDDNDQSASSAHQRFKEVAELFGAQSPKVKVSYLNPIHMPEEAKALEVNSKAEISLEYKGRKNKFEDFTEQGFTNAIIKVTRDKNKIIYFVTGHGERDLSGTEPTDLSNFKKYLGEASYDVKTLNFVEKQAVPDDAAVVIVAGPKQAYFDPEINSLKEYLYKGGHLLVALDPGNQNNLGKLTHDIGIDFKNDYILDPIGQIVGGSMALVMGTDFSRTSDITRGFRARTLFQLVSEVVPAKDKPEGITLDEVIKNDQSFARPELSTKDLGKEKIGVHTIMISATGKLKEEQGKGTPQEFTALVVGDSDFLDNQMIDFQLNHDLVLNSVAFLAKDKELVSIRPKKAEGNMVTESEIQKSLLFWILVILAPGTMFVTGGVFWYRRRTV